eukprot:TRINITY_DN1037_c0_g1_i23.p1 TRINITY_DN1037_c0_g1~~TRINITY_DN1037_c0_g1_i23.p1  ORF type:complete len:291 (+),score=82.50 TRINITY_DN1037_c0_g1_i23:263-1135(+)
MKFFFALLALACCQEMLITREKTDKLKKTVKWKVVDYEDNVFRGWTVEEFDRLLGLKKGEPKVSAGHKHKRRDMPLPETIDWRAAGCDHGVKDQKKCGSCWAFAVVGMMSYRCCAASKDHGWLSPQELVSCDDNNLGCSGGQLLTPQYYIQENQGLVREECFPYEAEDSDCRDTCKDGSEWKEAHVCNCAQFEDCDDGTDDMKECLSSGPVTFRFDVYSSFMYYKDGIYECNDEDEYRGGHAVLAMGYSDSPQCHYIAKNSWGVTWGNEGYFNIACETCELSGGLACLKF